MTPADIAKALTPAQVRALRAFCVDTNPHPIARLLVQIGPMPWARQMKAALERKGCVVRNASYPGLVTPTPLGLAVLAALDKEPT